VFFYLGRLFFWYTLTCFHPNAIPNSIVVAKNLVTSLLHVAPITFCHMDPTTFQVQMKDFHDAQCANSIL
jgi:hypothetical protein